MSEQKFQLKGRGKTLTVYEDHILIESKGILGFASQGFAGGKTIPMESIKSIQFRKGGLFVNGFIQFGIEGGKEKQGGISSAAMDENSIVFLRSQNKLAEEIKSYVEESIFANRNKVVQSIIQNQNSSADEILKFKDLLDKGVITLEEFETKKKELLGL